MQETWARSLDWDDSLEKGKVTHSIILAWRIPWTVQFMVSQRVRHDWATFTFTFFLWGLYLYLSFSSHHTLMKQAPACPPFYKQVAQARAGGSAGAGIQTQAGGLQTALAAIQWTGDHTFLRQTLGKVNKTTQEPRARQTAVCKCGALMHGSISTVHPRSQHTLHFPHVYISMHSLKALEPVTRHKKESLVERALQIEKREGVSLRGIWNSTESWRRGQWSLS